VHVKWQSRRWWVCLWAMFICSIIVGYGVYVGDIPGGMGTAFPLLVGVVGGYIAADSYTKGKEK
jgi:hypothetical protein